LSEADLDPIDKKPLVPAFATTKKIPELSKDDIAIFNVALNKWEKTKNYVGETWYDSDRLPVVIEELGDPAELGLSKEPKPLTLDEAKQEALENLNIEHAKILRNLSGNATIEERDTWQSKALAALAYSKGEADQFQTEMLETEATMVDEPVAELVAKIIARNSAFQKMIGIASGHRRATEKAIEAAQDLGQLQQVMDQAAAKAQTLVQRFIAATQG